MALKLSSPAFTDSGDFPADFTCNGRNVSPPLAISGVPQSASSLVLLFDDPDAAKEPAGNGSTFDHWVAYNMPANDQEITEDTIPKESELGKNSMGSSKYIGPCPPTFRHEYIFRLIALDKNLDFTNQPTKSEVEVAMRGHIIEETKLVSYYEQTS